MYHTTQCPDADVRNGYPRHSDKSVPVDIRFWMLPTTDRIADSPQLARYISFFIVSCELGL